MPLYEYQCDDCGHRFELIQKFSDPPPENCPNCGGPVKKLPSSPAIQFKGSGFYINDYARKGDGEAARKESKKKEESKAEPASGDAKPSTESKAGDAKGTPSKDSGGTPSSSSS